MAAPRSGTRYLASLLRAAGFDAGHERFGREGCVSSYMAVYDDAYHGRHGRLGEQKHQGMAGEVWHLLRHPLDTIGSIAGGMWRGWWLWQERHTGLAGIDQPELAARFWLAWQQKIEADPEVRWRLRVEDVERDWHLIQARLDIGRPPPEAFNPAIGHSSRSRRISLAELPGPVAEQVSKRAAEYGYSLEDE